ncbi:MAG TPA: hypothetical protein VK464_10935 [Symbiobacteriaceae bacterium]|nr:hypothetical protein [Symbiobacteriaceae bacterium]
MSHRWWVRSLAALCLLAVTAGCGSGSAKPGPLVVVLVDATSSGGTSKAGYQQDFDKVLQAVPGGTHLVVLPVDADASVNRPAVDRTLPRYDPLTLDPHGGNERTYKQERDRMVADTKQAVAELLGRPPSGRAGTAILESMTRAGRLFAAEPGVDHYLVVLSDMVEQSERDFTALQEQDVQHIVDGLRTESRIPDLHAKVFVSGITTGGDGAYRMPDGQLRTIEHFWTAYFKAAGATVEAWDSTLVKFCPGGGSCGSTAASR